MSVWNSNCGRIGWWATARPGRCANRDPALFERPNEFDTIRGNARDHISFGTGIHACLGAPLARMELNIGLRALFERFPQLALAGEPILNESTLLHGFKHLPVNLGPTRVALGS